MFYNIKYKQNGTDGENGEGECIPYYIIYRGEMSLMGLMGLMGWIVGNFFPDRGKSFS